MLVKTKVKYIQSLSHKKFRDEYHAFVIEGPKIVEEFLLNVPERILELFAVPGWLELQKTSLKKIPENLVHPIDVLQLERISALPAPNQVLALVKQREKGNMLPPENDFSLLLENVQDPGNLGTIIRTADWFGIQHVFCSEDSADVYNSKVVQASMGSILRVNVQYGNLAALVKKTNLPVFAATLDGEDFRTATKGLKQGLIIFGNESRGISDALLSAGVRKITIPGIGQAESLNAAVAASIIMAQLKLQNLAAI